MKSLFSSQPYTFDRVIRLIITIIILVGIIWLINYLRGVLLPFLFACLLAYIMHPLVLYNKQKLRLKGDVLPVILTLFEITFIITVSCVFLFPYIVNEIQQMAVMFQKYAQSQVNVPYLPDSFHGYIIKYLNFDNISNFFSHEELMSMLEKVIAELWTIMDSSVRMVIAICSWIVVVLYLVFILIDYDHIMGGIKAMIPAKYRHSVFSIFNDIETSMNHYFRGQALVSFIVGVLFSIGFLIVGLPMAIVFGLFIGLLNMVPYLQLISLPMAAVLCLVASVNTGENFWILFGETFAVYCIAQVIQDVILIPKIMGKYMGLNPAIIFLSLSIWGSLLGFIGLIIALPLTTLLISYYDRFIIKNEKLLKKESARTSKETEE